MCCGCSSTTQKVWSFSLGIIILALSITIGVLWPKISTDLINKELQLTEYSTNYQNWIKSPFPLYLEFYFWNFTNWEEFNVESEPARAHAWKNTKPILKEIGPFVFEEIHERVGLVYNDDQNELAFNQTKTWWFREDLSISGLDAKITSLNPISLSASYATRYLSAFQKNFVDSALTQKGAMFTTAPVNEWLFDGFEDGMIDLYHEIQESGDLPGLPPIPYEKFGWFMFKNASATVDGRFEIFTGKDDINKLGIFKTWKGKDTVGFMEGECDKIKGTTGELWPPFDTKAKEKPSATMFIPDVCRSLTLNYAGDFERHGIKGWKWVGDDSLFDNGDKYPETACFCMAHEDDCPNIKAGIFNTSSCQMGAPAFASFPHFYLADESYLEGVEGLSPDKEKHEMYMALEPNFGLPLEVKARLQINLFLRNDPAFHFYKDVPDLYIPTFWFTNSAELPEDLAEEAKMIYLVQDVGMWVSYTLAAVGSVCILLGVYFMFSKRTKEPSTFELTKT